MCVSVTSGEMAIEDAGSSPSLTGSYFFSFFVPHFYPFLSYLSLSSPCLLAFFPLLHFFPTLAQFPNPIFLLLDLRTVFGSRPFLKYTTGPGIGVVAPAPSRGVPSDINSCVVLLPRHLAKSSCVLFFRWRTPRHLAKSTNTTWK